MHNIFPVSLLIKIFLGVLQKHCHCFWFSAFIDREQKCSARPWISWFFEVALVLYGIAIGIIFV